MLNRWRPRSGALARVAILAAQVMAIALLAQPAQAWHRHWSHHVVSTGYAASPTDPSKDAALIIDGATGRQLYARSPDALRHPASLTKMMTLYLLFDALKQGKISLTSQLYVSQHAAEQRPTNLHLSAGDSIPVETAIKAIVVRSANDVAVAIAEGLGGTESHFAEMMTAKAREFGMRSTYYHNASGLPDPLQITSASDLAILARHLAYDFPQYFPYFATPSFYYRGTNYVTHDNLIGRYDGADGIKTGYTQMSGFNLVSSVVRGGVHVIGVVMGGRTAHLRDREMVRLLDGAFVQIAANPSLVARAQIPWQTVAQAAVPAAPIATSGFTPAPQSGGTTVATLAPPPSYTNAIPGDEDAAEAQTNEGNIGLAPQTRVAPLPKPTALPPPALPATAPVLRAPSAAVASASAPAIRPTPKPLSREPLVAQSLTAAPQQHIPIVIAAFRPQQKPAQTVAQLVAKPAPKPTRTEIGEGDISYDRIGSTIAAMNHGDWAIQIGAFANQSQARAQLAAYAEKSMDVLGQASRLVAPFQAVDGRTMYRARFGSFAEREAREVCSRLSQRGQTCFVVSDR